MATHEGIVIEVGDGTARVRLDAPAGCASCAASGGCTAGDPSHTVDVVDPVGVRPGQSVKIEVSGSVTVTAALLLYGMPVLALVIGAIIGPEIVRVLGGTVSTNMSAAVGGLLLLGGAIVGARVADRWFSSNPELGPRIVRVIKSKPVTTEETDGQKHEGC